MKIYRVKYIGTKPRKNDTVTNSPYSWEPQEVIEIDDPAIANALCKYPTVWVLEDSKEDKLNTERQAEITEANRVATIRAAEVAQANAVAAAEAAEKAAAEAAKAAESAGSDTETLKVDAAKKAKQEADAAAAKKAADEKKGGSTKATAQ